MLDFEVSNSYALGFCCRNSCGSTYTSYCCIVVLQKNGASPNVPLKCVGALERNCGVQMYVIVARYIPGVGIIVGVVVIGVLW